MSKKSKNKQDKKIINFPFSNEVKQAKEEFKRMIDDMTDEQFMEFSFLMMTITSDIDDNWAEDEEWEDEAEKFYNKGKNNINNFPTENDDLPF